CTGYLTGSVYKVVVPISAKRRFRPGEDLSFCRPTFLRGLLSESCTYHDFKRRPPLQAAACGLTVIEYVSAVAPIVTAEQVTGVSLIIKVTFCKFGQVHLFHLFKGKIFVIAVLAYISIVKFAH